ncbi:hypothetical protein [Desulfoplanes formicivorans]|uniref:Cytochrome c domain-containing protein n=1 Tax=Desulfoplanes formicivorans TaxID=1592317 RepID=A0A194AG01_9BACT|nr:hypothetical protein [Desulfoplanes formicivorans]GAU08011.1 hypothetical protein DPF_0712 [Desulfoplanes formicivorans]
MIRKNALLKTALAMILAFLLPGALLLAAPPAMNQVAMDQGTMVTTSCTRCHSLKRVCAKLGSNTQEWQSTLNRMQAKDSGLSTQQNIALAEFLATTTALKADFCR